MFTGLCAFPITPLNEAGIDVAAFVTLINRLVNARVDSIGVLGSTGSYAYLSRRERQQLISVALEHAGHIPVMVGIGALRTRDVLLLAEDAQMAGAQGVLLPPMSYQKLSDHEVFDLYKAVTYSLSIPLCVYDNPNTTQFTFSDELHAKIAQLPHVASIKIPAVSQNVDAAQQRIHHLRAGLPAEVTIGISGDPSAATGLLAGCEAWYSVIGGLFPHTALALTRSAQAGDPLETARLSNQLAPLWTLFQRFGSLRVMGTAAELCGLATGPCLPLPVQPLRGADRHHLQGILSHLSLN